MEPAECGAGPWHRDPHMFYDDTYGGWVRITPPAKKPGGKGKKGK